MDNISERLLQIRPRLVFYFLRRGCGDEAEDLAQETLRRILASTGSASENLPADQSVYTFAKYVLSEWRRKRERVGQIDPDAPEPADPLPSPEEAMRAREIHSMNEERLAICWAALEPAERNLLAVYHREGESKQQLASQLNIKYNTLIQRVHYAKEKLRRCMKSRQAAAPVIAIRHRAEAM